MTIETEHSVLHKVLQAFNIKDAIVKPFGSGLINSTWEVCSCESRYILQKINALVFKQPGDIAFNVRLIAEYLKRHHPGYNFIYPVLTGSGEDLLRYQNEGYFRLTPFVENSHTIDVVQTPGQAYEAAKQFGRFTKVLSGFDATQLKITIPHFHDLTLRYQQFLKAATSGNKERRTVSQSFIHELLQRKDIVDEYRAIINNPQFTLRVTHHDTKISNVLFDQNNKGLCVIDLDTVMPGYFISDVGDMMRTYLSPVSEEEGDVDKIMVLEEFYNAIVEGYSAEMKNELSPVEKKYFLFAGKFMIYMQALRFMTDYLDDDIYYKTSYKDHNLVRAKNQATLLKRLIELEKK